MNALSNAPVRPDLSAPTSIRPATTDGDWRAATLLLDEYAAWIEAQSDIKVLEAQPGFADDLADLGRSYASDRSILLLADDAGTINGTLAVRIDAAGEAELKRMYVRPHARGRGTARRLLIGALAWAEQAGASRAWLETLPGVMDPAIGLYRRHGFRRSRVPAPVGVDAAIVMTLELPRGVQP